MDDLKRIERSALARLGRAKTHDAVAQIRASVLGKKGALGEALRSVRDLAPAERPKAGEKINKIKVKLEERAKEVAAKIDAKLLEMQLEDGRVDVTLPGRRQIPGGEHPLRIVEDEIVRSLRPLGFVVAQGPLVEHDWYNFEALNIPKDHPARDMQDTFFVDDSVVLRTHTSNVQIRTMLSQDPPVRILAPGMVFRNDEVDATHSPVFHQIEGLWVDEHASFADLKGVLRKLSSDLFGPEAKLRFRPSFFPFTEPSAEVDVSCVLCGGGGKGTGHGGVCHVCRGTGWIEILGAGMVHPAVLEAVGYDPEIVQGFAFGAGLERIAMLRWGVDDIRLFYENDLRFLQQFSSHTLS